MSTFSRLTWQTLMLVGLAISLPGQDAASAPQQRTISIPAGTREFTVQGHTVKLLDGQKVEVFDGFGKSRYRGAADQESLAMVLSRSSAGTIATVVACLTEGSSVQILDFTEAPAQPAHPAAPAKKAGSRVSMGVLRSGDTFTVQSGCFRVEAGVKPAPASASKKSASTKAPGSGNEPRIARLAGLTMGVESSTGQGTVEIVARDGNGTLLYRGPFAADRLAALGATETEIAEVRSTQPKTGPRR